MQLDRKRFEYAEIDDLGARPWSAKGEGPTVQELLKDVAITAIVFAASGNQIRQVITGTKTHHTFVYPSKRYLRSQAGDGATELLINKFHEVVIDTLDFLPQPCRVEGNVRGRAAKAIPDFAYVAADRRPVLGEAKSDWTGFERPAAVIQRALTMKAAEALGWDYEQKTAQNIGSPVFLANIEEIHLHRFVHVPMRVVAAATAALAGGRIQTMDEMSRIIGETPERGRGLICAMMVARVLQIDLEAPLGGSSIVKAAPELPFAFPRIRL